MMWLQWGSDILNLIFERDGIISNMAKMVDMMFYPGPISRRQSATSYGWQMTGKGDPHCVKKLRRLVCGECGAELAMAYMASYIHMKHGR